MRSLLRDLVLDQKDQRARKASNGGTLAVTGALAGMGMADLSDVDLIDNPAADGQTLVWSDNEGKWLPQDAAGATALANLTDVDLATVPPTDGQTLVYDAGTGIWVPGDTGGGTLASLTDVDASSFQTGYTLVYSGSNWYATSRALSNLPDVDLSSGLSSGKVLGYNGSKWIPTTRPTTLSGLSDTSISSPAAGDYLYYDGTSWVNGHGAVPIGVTELTISNATKQVANVRRHITGAVELQLKLVTNTSSNGKVLCTLPSWAWPSGGLNVPTATHNTPADAARLDINTNGQCTCLINPDSVTLFGTVVTYTP